MSGSDLRDEGHRQVAFTFSAIGDDWAARARLWIESVPKGSLLDADDLRAAVGTPFHANAPGAIIRRAALDDLIEPFGWKESERKERRAAAIRIWRRL